MHRTHPRPAPPHLRHRSHRSSFDRSENKNASSEDRTGAEPERSLRCRAEIVALRAPWPQRALESPYRTAQRALLAAPSRKLVEDKTLTLVLPVRCERCHSRTAELHKPRLNSSTTTQLPIPVSLDRRAHDANRSKRVATEAVRESGPS
jgi:hypothetical protein